MNSDLVGAGPPKSAAENCKASNSFFPVSVKTGSLKGALVTTLGSGPIVGFINASSNLVKVFIFGSTSLNGDGFLSVTADAGIINRVPVSFSNCFSKAVLI